MHEIEAKTILGRVKQPDPWFGLSFNMNLYRGCQHGCIYCDSRSECYGIDNFEDIAVKKNAVALLRKELSCKRFKGVIGFGAMNDPYMPLEEDLCMTRQALQVVAEFGFPVHILTKSDLAVRDIDLLVGLSKRYAAVSFTITTPDDELAAKVEPGAPSPTRRLAAMKRLASAGVITGTCMMPVLPFIEDKAESIARLIDVTREAGGRYIIPGFGMTLRDRQRDYYYARLDRLFPGIADAYRRRFGERYSCSANNARSLERMFRQRCAEAGIAVAVPPFSTIDGEQMRLF